MEETLIKLLRQANYAPLDAQGLAEKLGISKSDLPQFEQTLKKLERTGQIARIRQSRYALPLDADLIPGRILINRKGGGILQPDDAKLARIIIPVEATATALHMDRVLVRRDARAISRAGVELDPGGKVIRILERARSQVVGTLQQSKQFLYIIPDDPRIPHDIYVPPATDKKREARVGDKVVVELADWPSRHNNPEGRIVEILGGRDERGVDMESVLRQYNLSTAFPPAVVREARHFGPEITRDDLRNRLDCRRQQVITIDPDDAKDFDDAIFLERSGKNQWKLWVHIADVSHYVKPGAALDEEALKRGNSTYLVDRVIPMLPEQLSNGLCSLKPNVDRLTKCVEFLISNEGRVLQADFHSAVIHSHRRFTYQEAHAILLRKPQGPIEEMLASANQLAQRIRQNRFKSGALDLEFPEFKIRLDEKGQVRLVEKMEYDESHQLIEEYMLLANEAVAKRLSALKRPAIHRIHEEPDLSRLEEYRQELALHNIPTGNLAKRGEAQKLLANLKRHPAGHVLKIGFLRSLKRARYAVEALGHFGLAKNDYTHFTSPIRRYADLIVHRALFEKVKLPLSAMTQWADHISLTERSSADAEQDSRTIKLLAHLEQQLKTRDFQHYNAIVTDVRNFGFFIELQELGMTGFIRVSTLEDDFYHFDSARGTLVGRRHRRVISPGEKVTVQIYKVDQFKKQADFTLVRKPLGARVPDRRGREQPLRRSRDRRGREQSAPRIPEPRRREQESPRPPEPRRREQAAPRPQEPRHREQAAPRPQEPRRREHGASRPQEPRRGEQSAPRTPGPRRREQAATPQSPSGRDQSASRGSHQGRGRGKRRR